MSESLAAIAASGGVLFMWIAALAVWRLPDFYQRTHAVSMAATLGLCPLLLALCLVVRGEAVVTKAVLIVLFLGATAPVGAHVLARAAYRTRVPWSRVDIDEYARRATRRDEQPDER